MKFKVNHKSELVPRIVNSGVPDSKHGYIVTIEVADSPKRPKTDSQRASLHLWCRELAGQLNDSGCDQIAVFKLIKEGVEVPWNESTVKENIWKPFQAAMVKKKFNSTEDLDSDEPSKIYDVINRWLSGHGMPCPEWPSRWNK